MGKFCGRIDKEIPSSSSHKRTNRSKKETVATQIMSSIKNSLHCVKNRLTEEVLAMEVKRTTLEEILPKVAGGNRSWRIAL